MRLASGEELIIGTRGSALARAQAAWVQQQLARLYPDWEYSIREIKTTGDHWGDVALSAIEGKGVFVKELEEALLAGEIHLAVHSIKDLPSQLPPDLVLGAITVREDPRDAWISRAGQSLSSVPAGARIGTSSLRRRAQLLAWRRDLAVENLRGNLDTRLRKLGAGDYDGIVVAKAGVARLGWAGEITEVLPVELMVPAAGQGALGIEIRAGNQMVEKMVVQLNHPESAIAVRAERAFLNAIGGGCRVPVGCLAEVHDGRIQAVAAVADVDGLRLLRAQREGSISRPEALGEELAQDLIDQGASQILAACRS